MIHAHLEQSHSMEAAVLIQTYEYAYDSFNGFWHDYRLFLEEMIPDNPEAHKNFLVRAAQTLRFNGGNEFTARELASLTKILQKMNKQFGVGKILLVYLTGPIDCHLGYPIGGEVLRQYCTKEGDSIQDKRTFRLNLKYNKLSFLDRSKKFELSY